MLVSTIREELNTLESDLEAVEGSLPPLMQHRVLSTW